ncbi:MAG: hypothetical protein H6742_15380 [Alphaproteobacteria bacterium]|nr:hypothetical protein [Alphaproteobacteria bacterium]
MRSEDQVRAHLVGIGPGYDPHALTLSARAAIESCDLVFYPGTQLGEAMRALPRGELVWGRHLDDQELRARALTALDRGDTVAWLFSGDPSLYTGGQGRFSSLTGCVRWLRQAAVEYRIHPGVSSLQVLLAHLGLEHAGIDTGQPTAVYAPGRDPEPLARTRLEALAALGMPLALFLAETWMHVILELGLRHYGPRGRVVVAHRIGWPDQWVLDCELAQLEGRLAGSVMPGHTLILIGPWEG